jgi:hypothetical protein
MPLIGGVYIAVHLLLDCLASFIPSARSALRRGTPRPDSASFSFCDTDPVPFRCIWQP